MFELRCRVPFPCLDSYLPRFFYKSFRPEVRLGNGLIHAVNYNNRLQPNEIKLGTSGSPASIVDLTYDYGTTTNNGNVQSIAYSGALSYTQSFGYDALNRLTRLSLILKILFQ